MIVNKTFLALLGLFYFILIEVNGQNATKDFGTLGGVGTTLSPGLKVENPKLLNPELKLNIDTSNISGSPLSIKWNLTNYDKISNSIVDPREGEKIGSTEILENNVIKIGAGNYEHSYLNLNLNKADQKIGFYINHDSYKTGSIAGLFSGKSENLANFWLRSPNSWKIELESAITYNQINTNYYGISEFNQIPTFRDKQLGINLWNVFAQIGNKKKSYNDKSKGINYNLKIDFSNLIKEGYVNENILSNELLSNINLNKNSSVNLKAELIFSSLLNGSQSHQRNFIRIRPYYTYSNNSLIITTGANLIFENENEKDDLKYSLFPHLNFSYKYLNWVDIFWGIGGDVQFNTYTNFLKQNYWIGKDLPIKNTSQVGNLYLGFKGTNKLDYEKPNDFAYELKLGFIEYKNFPIFYNDFKNESYFSVSYLDNLQRMQMYSLSGNIDYRINKYLKLNSNFNYDIYEKFSGLFNLPLNRPLFRLNINFVVNLSDKLEIYPTSEILGGLNGFDGKNMLYVKMDDIYLMNLKIKYKFNKRIHLSTSLNNLNNKTYQRYLNYKELGFNFNSTLEYSF